MPEAIPGRTVSTPPSRSAPGGGLLRVVSGAELDAQAHYARSLDAAARAPASEPDLAAFVRQQWTIFRNHRNTGEDPLNQRLLRCQRMFSGRYDPPKLAEIVKFGGSQVYSRLVAVKCRGATSLLRDVYLGPSRPWGIDPEPDPPVPPEIQGNIMQLVGHEVATQQMSGQPVARDQVHARVQALQHAAQQAARRNAKTQADAAADKIDDILSEGGFYESLAEFLVDLPLFPFAVLKGPVVRMRPRIVWNNGQADMQSVPQMRWERKSPFDIYWSPGASVFSDADIIERQRLTRTDLNDLIGLPGYNEDAIRGVLEDYSHGLRDWLDAPDSEQAIYEGRENPTMNRSGMIDALEYHGNVQGQLLLDNGLDPKLVPDPDRDYSVRTWVIGRYVLKTQINPSPRQRHPYFLTSFEKVPGTVSGHALPDLLEDLQEVANAALRASVNNMAIASGPQVVINDEALAPTENGDELYPWKRWHIQGDPLGNQRDPISFFQPSSNAQELMGIYAQVTNIADEVSAIPRYITGSERLGGAGRTASGLSMLMGNAEKVLQTVAANVDIDVMQPMLEALYDMIMLTDQSGMLTGQEEIRVRGVNVAVQKETERQKQLQFLQITANPIDAPIVGELGRARVLRAVAQGLGLPDDIVPDDQTLQTQIQAQQQAAQTGAMLSAQGQGQAQAQGQPPGDKPSQPPGASPSPPAPAAQAQGAQAPRPGPARLADHAPPVNLQQQGIPSG